MLGINGNYAQIKNDIERLIAIIKESEHESFVLRKKLRERSYTFENAFSKLPKQQRKKLSVIRKATPLKKKWRSIFRRESALYGRASAFNLLMCIAKDGDLWIFPARQILILEFAITEGLTATVAIDGVFEEMLVELNRAPALIHVAADQDHPA
jgi:hypothetical protein